MHFRKITALVLREFVSRNPGTNDPKDVTRADFIAWCNNIPLKNDVAQAIIRNLCGQELASDHHGSKAVGWWLSHPETLANVFSFFLNIYDNTYSATPYYISPLLNIFEF